MRDSQFIKKGSPVYKVIAKSRNSYVKNLVHEIRSHDKKISDMGIKFSAGKQLGEDLPPEDEYLMHKYVHNIHK